MSLLPGKSKSSCKAVSEESSSSLEHEESEPAITLSSFRVLLPVAEYNKPFKGTPVSVVTPEMDPHFADEDA